MPARSPLCASLLFLVVAPQAVAAPSGPTLNGEELNGALTSAATDDCHQGIGPEPHVEYAADGTATGAYRGSFEATGVVNYLTLPPGDNGLVRQAVTSHTVEFEIRSRSRTVTGTMTLVATDASAGVCAGGLGGEGANATTRMTYVAEAATRAGVVHDRGTAAVTLRFTRSFVPGAPLVSAFTADLDSARR